MISDIYFEYFLNDIWANRNDPDRIKHILEYMQRNEKFEKIPLGILRETINHKLKKDQYNKLRKLSNPFIAIDNSLNPLLIKKGISYLTDENYLVEIYFPEDFNKISKEKEKKLVFESEFFILKYYPDSNLLHYIKNKKLNQFTYTFPWIIENLM